ncbi:hypothetical protein [Halorubrum sp. JWXQ-INN 858]|nr:hypothetical protein [Halorubrum sp. JWXQ-INN 858]
MGERSTTDRSTMGDVDHTPRNADVNDVWIRGPDGAAGTERTDE